MILSESVDLKCTFIIHVHELTIVLTTVCLKQSAILVVRAKPQNFIAA